PAEAAPEAAADVSTLGGGGQPTTDRLIFINYQVQPGDTLFRIQTNQITTIALMARFGISAADLVVGNVLSLPVGDPNACSGWRPYVVLRGDTAFGISQFYGISLQELQARNGLDANYSLYETQVICVPY
ncbi:MAG TPA: LysM peptidoglycan-binding domain-containing protein, partial [Chloroflexota bacterium]|nr:LysM peptidoglycan-binding domain-containing protein [Chloroflexota bacterium]